jgi:hypothetical protein
MLTYPDTQLDARCALSTRPLVVSAVDMTDANSMNAMLPAAFVDSLLDGLSDMDTEIESIDDGDNNSSPDGCGGKNNQTKLDEMLLSQPKRKRQRITLKQEIDYLREKEHELQYQLYNLTSKMNSCDSVWATRAMGLNVATQRTIQENAVLRKMVEDQLKTIHTLERVFRRKPKLAVRIYST